VQVQRYLAVLLHQPLIQELRRLELGMAVKSVLYNYKLECGHYARAQLYWYQKRDPKEPVAYHTGDKVKCQKCQYIMRKIVSETKQITEE
jgi:hypothetical protein